MDTAELETLQVDPGKHGRTDLMVQLNPGKTQDVGQPERKSSNTAKFFIPHMVEREAS